MKSEGSVYVRYLFPQCHLNLRYYKPLPTLANAKNMSSPKIILFLLLNLLLTACGQPGPLYLPDKAPPTPTQPDKK